MNAVKTAPKARCINRVKQQLWLEIGIRDYVSFQLVTEDQFAVSTTEVTSTFHEILLVN